jgi:hypothetical protein
MSKPPPLEELEFLKLVPNHGELTRKLQTIGTPAPDVLEYAKHICECWFKLAEEHLAEAQVALTAKCTRAVFSRSYYAAYNASKAARYIVSGWVSLKGDDHGRASAELPNDLPDVAQRSQDVTVLYEHRLRADYENWSTSSNSLRPEDAIGIARAFIDGIRAYINAKFGMAL